MAVSITMAFRDLNSDKATAVDKIQRPGMLKVPVAVMYIKKPLWCFMEI